MKRAAHPSLSSPGQEALACYEHWLREREDLAPASMRNYPSDLRHFIAWYGAEREAPAHDGFTPQRITTPALTRYRAYLQTVGQQKPASVNRCLISLKRYFDRASQHQLITYDPAAAVKLVGQEESAPRHLDDQKEPGMICNKPLKALPGHRGHARWRAVSGTVLTGDQMPDWKAEDHR